jgi:ABC-type dipeptide/oligopeptide/nickel transport system ATPase subunit
MENVPDILELRDLRVLLGGQRRLLRRPVLPVRAVGGVSLSVRQGEILGLVGESECGKTTLGRAVLGLQRESGGEIRLDGKLVSGLPPKRARIVRNDIHYVHQDAAAALDPWWSIGRTLEEGLRIHGISSGRSGGYAWTTCWRRSASTARRAPGIRTNSPAASCAVWRSRASWC